MTFPHTFAPQAGPIPLQYLDDNFNALTAPTGSSLVGFIQSGTGAVATTVQSKLREIVSLTDKMTAAQISDASGGSPTLDIKAALQAAVDTLPSTGGVVVLPPYPVKMFGTLPSGTSRVTDGVKLKSNVSIVGVKGASQIILDTTCAVAFTTRPLVAYTDLSQVPINIGFYGIKFACPSAVWSVAAENTAPIYIPGVNGLTIRDCQFIGWQGDAVLLGSNDDSSCSVSLQTYVNNIEINSNNFDGVTNLNRQCISLLCGTDVYIHHNTFARSTRTAAPAMPGAIDLEPNITTALFSNVRIEDNVFDSIGGATGVISVALTTALATPAHDIFIKNNTFRNSLNSADIFILGKTAADHTAIAVGSPYTIEVSGNTHQPATNTNRRWLFGGIQDIRIFDNIVEGGGYGALFGYDDGGAGHYPIKGFYFTNNVIRNLVFDASIYVGILYANGGLLSGEISRNTFIDCGNSVAGVPANMTVLQMTAGGLQSKNLNVSANTFINSGAYSAYSFPLYAGALANPSSIVAKNNTFIGFLDSPYTSANSLYSQAVTDFYIPFVSIPSTAVPSVIGAVNFTTSTGDTITNFSGGQDGQSIKILNVANGCTVQNNANVLTRTGANTSINPGQTISFINHSSKWYQV